VTAQIVRARCQSIGIHGEGDGVKKKMGMLRMYLTRDYAKYGGIRESLVYDQLVASREHGEGFT
jgi:hypothetical protein